jgi:uncharacterized membrane protein HdeD (DUF308 family)
MLQRDSATTVGLLGGAMSVSASLFAMMLPGSGSLVLVLIRAIPFAPIGAICALLVWGLRRGRELPSAHRTALVALAAIAGAVLAALLDFALAALRPGEGLTVTGGDLIMGGLTGALAGYIGAIKPMARG